MVKVTIYTLTTIERGSVRIYSSKSRSYGGLDIVHESSGFDLLPNTTLVYQSLFRITYYYFQSLAAFTTILAASKIIHNF
jgi:hypothetical protein